ncbi:MAG: hypothetical protein AAFX87_01015 [Bacteroidota bacterium]
MKKLTKAEQRMIKGGTDPVDSRGQDPQLPPRLTSNHGTGKDIILPPRRPTA